MTVQDSFSPAAETGSLSQLERVVDAYIEPSKTFADIRRSRSWWLPFLIFSVLGYVFMGTVVHRVGWQTLAENVLKNNPKAEERISQQTPEQQAQTMAMTRISIQVASYASPAIVLLSTALLALLLWAGFSLVLGGKCSFADMFAVGMYAWLPTALVSIVAIGSALIADPQNYNLSQPAPTNLGYFMDPDTAGWLRSLGTSLDIFSLWALILAGYGGAIVARVKPLRGIVMVLAGWGVFVLLKTGISAIFG